MIDKVLDHLYVSGAGPVVTENRQSLVSKLQISNIVTISATAIPPERRLPDVEYKFVFAMDVPEQEILSHLGDVLPYIEDCIKNAKNVLVHCEAGMSRSACIVVAYVMRLYSWPCEKALEFVKNVRPVAQPNHGFLEQLKIFESIGFSIDQSTLATCQKYRLWCFKTGNKTVFERLPSASQQVEINMKEDAKGNKFRCGKCRQVLFFSEHVMRHNRQDGQNCSFGYLIEPMKWMHLDEYQGKIACPSCGEKIGNYSWGGRTCQGEHGQRCSEHVTPWVQLHKAKIDEVTPRLPMEQISRAIEVPSVIVSQ